MKSAPFITSALLLVTALFAGTACAMDSSSVQLNATSADVASKVWCCTTKDSKIYISKDKSDPIQRATYTCPTGDVMTGYTTASTIHRHKGKGGYYSKVYVQGNCAKVESPSCYWVEADQCPNHMAG